MHGRIPENSRWERRVRRLQRAGYFERLDAGPSTVSGAEHRIGAALTAQAEVLLFAGAEH
jgi:hypothetical protein